MACFGRPREYMDMHESTKKTMAGIGKYLTMRSGVQRRDPQKFLLMNVM